MPLPIGTQKNRNDLRIQADATFKSNGGAGIGKTGGANERLFVADYLETTFLKTDKAVLIKTGNTSVSFDNNCIYVGGLSLFRNTDIVLDFANAKRGCVAKFLSQKTTEPIITGLNLKLLEAESIEPYDSTKINVYIFRFLGQNVSNFLVEYNRYTIA